MTAAVPDVPASPRPSSRDCPALLPSGRRRRRQRQRTPPGRFALLPGFVGLLLSGCAVHIGAPSTSPPPVSEPAGALPHSRQTVTYAERASPLRAELRLPQSRQPLPAVVLVHGGGWSGGAPEDMAGIARRLAEAGFAVLNIAYRLAPDHRHPAQIDDLASALGWLRTEATTLGIDPDRIGVWGYSAGAHLAALAGTRLPVPARPRAIVAGGLPADLRRYPDSPLIARLIGSGRDEAPQAWLDASPLPQVDAETPPTFLYHGSWDWVVGADNARDMHAALQRHGVRSELYLIRGYGHFAAFLWHRGAEDAAIAFLLRQLALP